MFGKHTQTVCVPGHPPTLSAWIARWVSTPAPLLESGKPSYWIRQSQGVPLSRYQAQSVKTVECLLCSFLGGCWENRGILELDAFDQNRSVNQCQPQTCSIMQIKSLFIYAYMWHRTNIKRPGFHPFPLELCEVFRSDSFHFGDGQLVFFCTPEKKVCQRSSGFLEAAEKK